MAAHSNILAWRILRRELGGYSPRGRKESDTTERLSTPPTHTQKLFIIEINPLTVIVFANISFQLSGVI